MNLVAREFRLRQLTSDQHGAPAGINFLRMPIGLIERKDKNLLQHFDHVVIGVVVVIEQYDAIERSDFRAIDDFRFGRDRGFCHTSVQQKKVSRSLLRTSMPLTASWNLRANAALPSPGRALLS